jgi:hypothetical protein
VYVLQEVQSVLVSSVTLVGLQVLFNVIVLHQVLAIKHNGAEALLKFFNVNILFNTN